MELNEAIEALFTEPEECHYKDIVSAEIQTKMEAISKKARLLGIDADKELIKQKVFERIMIEAIDERMCTIKDCVDTILREYCSLELSSMKTRAQRIAKERGIRTFKVYDVNTVYGMLPLTQDITLELRNSKGVTDIKLFGDIGTTNLVMEYNSDNGNINIGTRNLSELIRKVTITIVAAFRANSIYSEVNKEYARIKKEWYKMTSGRCRITNIEIYNDAIFEGAIKMLNKLKV